jgi:predicted nucleic acid-binding protein
MIIVLDTSAAVEIVLRRGNFEKLGNYIAEAEWIIVPYLYVSEVTNTFWKYHTMTDFPVELCETSIDTALAFPDEFIDERELYKEAFSMGCLFRKPVYDMFFLVLARRHNANLITLDNSLKKAARKQSIRVL